MDIGRIRRVCAFYIIDVGARYYEKMEGDSPLSYLVLDFLPRLIKMISAEPDRREKIMRWYGFAQGALYAQGAYTIDELKDHSRPDLDPPTITDRLIDLAKKAALQADE